MNIVLPRWNSVDECISAQVSFSNKYQRWNNIGSPKLNRPNSINVFSTLFCQSWNNVDKNTSAQFSFLTKYYQCSNNFGSSNLKRRNSVDIVWTLFCQGETVSMNVRQLKFHFQTNINVETTLMNVNDQHCVNVDSTLMCLMCIIQTFWEYFYII